MEGGPWIRHVRRRPRFRASRSTRTSTRRCSPPSCSASCSGISTRSSARRMKPLGDGFIKLIKMLIAPIIFCTVVHGIASMEDMKKVGRVGVKALIYFEVMTTLALIVGLVVVNMLAARRRHERRSQRARHQGDRGLHGEGRASRARSSSSCTSSPPPWSAPSPKARSCRCCFFAVLFALRAVHAWASAGKPLLAHHRPDRRMSFFGIVGIVMKAGADRRFRRDGLHHRQVRRRHAAPRSAQLMLAFYADLPDLRVLRAGHRSRWFCGLQHPQVHQVHQGRAADRARHLVVRVGAAAHDRQDGESRLQASRSSAW